MITFESMIQAKLDALDRDIGSMEAMRKGLASELARVDLKKVHIEGQRDALVNFLAWIKAEKANMKESITDEEVDAALERVNEGEVPL